jgi:hypothetical protein
MGFMAWQRKKGALGGILLCLEQGKKPPPRGLFSAWFTCGKPMVYGPFFRGSSTKNSHFSVEVRLKTVFTYVL